MNHKVPQDVIEAAKDKRLVFFVGSGVSMNVGAQSWYGFAQKVFEQLRKKGKVNYGFIDQIKNLQPKRQLSIARILAEKHDIEIDYKEAIVPKSKNDSEIYDYLGRIKACYVTTNYDTYLHNMLIDPFGEKEESNFTKRNTIIETSKIDNGIIEVNNVIHLHGSYMNGNDDLVVTTKDYINHYKKPGVRNFLTELFTSDYVIVFLGYSLEEIEILDYLLLKADGVLIDKGNTNNKRFWLQGVFSHQLESYKTISEYYKKVFQIEMLMYLLDENYYEELSNILRKWADAISGYMKPSTEKMRFLDEVLES